MHRSVPCLAAVAAVAAAAAAALLTTGSAAHDSAGAAARPAAYFADGIAGEGGAMQSSRRPDAGPTLGEAALDLSSDRSAAHSRGITGRLGPEVPREGRTSSLLPLLRREGLPVAGEVRFVAGPERGARVPVAAAEHPEPVALLPGFAIFEARLEDGSLCRRELLLDHRRECRLELDFAARGVVWVGVTDEAGAPVDGTSVSLDGEPAQLDRSGLFRCPVRVSGAPLLTASAPGYAPYRQALPESIDTGAEPLSISLTRGTDLTIRLDHHPAEGTSGAVTLNLLPSGGPMSRSAPLQSLVAWEQFSTVTVPAGGSLRLEGLPPCRLEVFAFHAGAAAGPEVAFVGSGEAAELTLTTAPLDTLRGSVLLHGEPVAGAAVSLRYANPIAATHRILGEHAKSTRRHPVEVLPQVAQDVVTDEEGRFAFGLDPRIREQPYVTVATEDRALSITRKVGDTSAELLFDLADPTH